MMADHKSIVEALAAFHADLPKVAKTSVNTHFKNKYASLEDITNVVLPALGKHGLAYAAVPQITDRGFVLHCELTHATGGSIQGEWPLPDGGAPQALGSALTYARRYMLTAMTGVAPDEDDDGNAAQAATRTVPRQAPAPPANWREVIAATTTVAELATLYQQAQAAGWLTGEIQAALSARKAEVGG